MRALTVLACSCLLIAGCSKSPTRATPPPLSRAWAGTFADGPTHGSVVIDVMQSGSALNGGVVFGHAPNEYQRVQGGLRGDSLRLENLSATSHLVVSGHVRSDGGLVGHMTFTLTGLEAELDCHPLPHLQVTREMQVDVPYAVEAMTYAAGDVWLSTATNDFVRMSPLGTVRDTVIIYYRPNERWTSSALTHDGSLLWGFLPGTVMSASGSVNYSDLAGFTAEGRRDSLRLWHRTGGLAYDGLDFWSLRADFPRLYRVRRFGAVVDSVDLEVPDAVHLECDGANLWTLGWYLKRIYKCDFAGHPLAIGELPGQDTGSLDGGLTAVGSSMWYAEDHAGYSTIHKLTLR